ncbi:S-adenosyl-L-methionine-dependent methyltransferase [Peziza echinospora]|nr:S-adenosyl-L-methionine-dependent methyltransferase [Peziza echinospora]
MAQVQSPARSPPAAAAEHALEAEVEIDDTYADETDSVYASTTSSSTTTSVTESVFDFTYSNGRRYASDRFTKAEYHMPNDEEEQGRLDLYHHIFLLIQDGKLYTAPLDRPQNVLDIGTGTGIWAIDFADEHPQAQVIGVDISPIQPRWVPPNVKFEVDDVEEDWTFKDDYFDFIHLRTMGGSIADWKKLLRQCYEKTKPGGFIEFQDYCTDTYLSTGERLNGENPDVCARHPIVKFLHHMNLAATKFGRPLDIPPLIEGLLADAGFVDIVVARETWPIGAWPKDPKLKTIGRWARAGSEEGLLPFALYLLTKEGWSLEEVKTLCADAKESYKTQKYYYQAWFVYARKPE